MITLKKTKSLKRITGEWDAIASLRDDQVCSGKDHSANFVLAPAILNELPKVRSLIDIGCGTGWLTEKASKCAETTVGVDPSGESIAIGRERHFAAGITYYAESIENYSLNGIKFDLAISNMSASSAPNLGSFLSASRNALQKNALFIFTIPHPCYWPSYWGYASHPNFDYMKSCAVEGEFKIQREVSDILTTHFHHPLGLYFTILANSKFCVEEVKEIKGRGFNLPRFMLIKSRAV